MRVQEKRVFSKQVDWLFLVFPIWIPASYILLEGFAGENAPVVTFAFIFLIGESHFLATLFFFSNENKSYILSRKKQFFAIPLFLLSANFMLFSVNLKYALILGALMSSYHVTRQSVGLLKLFGGKNAKLEFDIYFFSLIFVAIGFLRTSSQYLSPENFLNRTTSSLLEVVDWLGAPLIMGCTFIYLVLRIYTCRNSLTKESIALYVTGTLLYSPYLYSSPTTASVIGVSMHWSQYLTLVVAISIHSGKLQPRKLLSNRILIGVASIVLVAGVIAVSDYSRLVNEINLAILIIPLSIQLLHYYYDSLIWRGSEPHLRETVFKRIFSN